MKSTNESFRRLQDCRPGEIVYLVPSLFQVLNYFKPCSYKTVFHFSDFVKKVAIINEYDTDRTGIDNDGYEIVGIDVNHFSGIIYRENVAVGNTPLEAIVASLEGEKNSSELTLVQCIDLFKSLENVVVGDEETFSFLSES